MNISKIKKAWLEGDWSFKDLIYTEEIDVKLEFYSNEKMEQLAKDDKILYPIAYVDNLKIFTDAGYEVFKDNAGVDFVIVQGVRVYLYFIEPRKVYQVAPAEFYLLEDDL